MNQIKSNHLLHSFFDRHLFKTTRLTNFVYFSSPVDYMAFFRCSSRLVVLRIVVLFYSIHCIDAQLPQVAQKPHIIMIVADDLVSTIFFNSVDL